MSAARGRRGWRAPRTSVGGAVLSARAAVCLSGLATSEARRMLVPSMERESPRIALIVRATSFSVTRGF